MASPTSLVPSKPQKPIDSLRRMLELSKEQISLALPKHMTPERMIRVGITAVQKQPKLLECSPLSIVGSIIEASQLGLEPDGILGQAYLVPFRNKKTSQMEAQLQVGYRGLISLAKRSGEVSSVGSELVYAADKFKVVFGVHRDLIHEPDLDNPDREESGLRGAYATVLFKDGTTDFEYMSMVQLDKIRESSKAKDFGPWMTHPEEMYRKCPIRRLAKRLPLSPEFQRAAVLDEYRDAGVAPSPIEAIDPLSEVVKMATEQKTQQLTAKYLPEDENQDAEPPIESYEANPPTPVAEQAPALPETQERKSKGHGRAFQPPTASALFGDRGDTK